jgi:hypothetical protein
MDTNLPVLDIVEDINEVMDDAPEQINQTIKDVEDAENEVDSPFIEPEKPKKKKRELSEKQKAHLDRIRKLAVEKKKQKADAKKEALKKVNEEHKPRSYKPRKKKTEEQKKYQERTKVIDDTDPREQQAQNQKTSTPDNFVPSHKAQQEEKRQNAVQDDKMSFMNFMGNMEKYLIMRDEYDKKKPKPKAQPKKVEQPIPKIVSAPPKPKTGFEDYFG